MKKIEVTHSRHTDWVVGVIKCGTYSEDCSRADVEKLVRGSFGGYFHKFEDGEFEYILDVGD